MDPAFKQLKLLLSALDGLADLLRLYAFE